MVEFASAVNLGDVIVEGGDLYGDAVIIAVRRPCRLPFTLARRRPTLSRPRSPPIYEYTP
jgi:hypothetical protein